MKIATTILVFCVGALVSLGLVVLASAEMWSHGKHILVMQFAWIGVGLVACLLAARIDYRHLKKISWWLLALAFLLLVLVLIPGIGLKIKGARRWLDLKVMHFQPSELAKLALIIAIAHYGERFQRHMGTFRQGVAVPGAFIVMILALIFAGHDYGTTILLMCVSAAMLVVAGASWRFLLPPIFVVASALAIAIRLNPIRFHRILAWLYLEENKDDIGFQAYQAMIALGAGGWTGVGLGDGRQKLGFVPDHHTDFIFSVIGEELGLVATLAVLVVFIVLVLCGIYIAWNARDTFGLLLASGVSFLIGLQAFVNIGVVTSALPNKGLTLPFVSYGGSNMVMMLASVGLLLSVARRAHQSVAVSETSDSTSIPSIQTT